MRIVLILAAVLSVAGCSIMPWGRPRPINEMQWTHPSKTREEFQRERYECERDNRGVKRRRINALREQCMFSKGWRRI